MDHPHDFENEGEQPPMPTQAELEAMFEADDADVAAGRIVLAEPVLAELRAMAERVRRSEAMSDETETKYG